MKEIIVTFDGKGGSTVETTGFSGADCLKETKDLETALGKVTKESKKAEFFVTQKAKVVQR